MPTLFRDKDQKQVGRSTYRRADEVMSLRLSNEGLDSARDYNRQWVEGDLLSAKQKKKNAAKKWKKGAPARNLKATEHRLARGRLKSTRLDINKKARSRVRKLGSGGEGSIASRTFFTPY